MTTHIVKDLKEVCARCECRTACRSGLNIDCPIKTAVEVNIESGPNNYVLIPNDGIRRDYIWEEKVQLFAVKKEEGR